MARIQGFESLMYPDRNAFRARGARIDLQPRGFFGRLFAVLGGLVLLVLGLMFSVVVIAVAVTLGLAVWGGFWWKTRALRRQMREQMQSMQTPFGDLPAGGGRVIEGEVIRDPDDTLPPR